MVSRGKLAVNVLLFLAFAFQLIGVFTPPITTKITLASYNNVYYGMLGYCNSTTSCSGYMIGYDTLQDPGAFTLDSSARLALSKLLVVHVIAAGCTGIMLVLSLFLHMTSRGYLTAMLVLSLPNFLVSLLAFLIVLLMFLNKLSFAAWFLIPGFVLNCVVIVFLCISHRHLSDKLNTHDSDDEDAVDYNPSNLSNFGFSMNRDDEKLIQPTVHSNPEYANSLGGSRAGKNGSVFHYYPTSGRTGQRDNYGGPDGDDSYQYDQSGYGCYEDRNLLNNDDSFGAGQDMPHNYGKYISASQDPLYLMQAQEEMDGEPAARPGMITQANPVLHEADRVYGTGQAAVYSSAAVAAAAAAAPMRFGRQYTEPEPQQQDGAARYAGHHREMTATSAADSSIYPDSQYEGGGTVLMPPSQVFQRGRVPSGPRTMESASSSSSRQPPVSYGAHPGSSPAHNLQDQPMQTVHYSPPQQTQPVMQYYEPQPEQYLAPQPSYAQPGFAAPAGPLNTPEVPYQGYSAPVAQPRGAPSRPSEPSKSEFALNNNPDFSIGGLGRKGKKGGRF